MSKRISPRRARTMALTALAFIAVPSSAQQASAQPASTPQPGTIEADGTVNVPPFALPPSIYLSEEAKKTLPRKPYDQEEPMYQALKAGKAGEMRARAGEFMAPRIKHLTDLYPATLRKAEIAGVPVIHVTPANLPAANEAKIMIDLPGGGFVMGTAPGTGMVESIPLAAMAGVEVESIPLAAMAGVEIVSISYRQAPEFGFPAASEDVAKVYRELLKTHKPQDIAMFGCSAGGLLTAESMAWFLKEKLPLPKAIGIFCASADARWGGDSRAFGRPFQALPARDAPRNYFTAQDIDNPLASPILTPDVLKRFPPTLLITATRAMEMSSAVNTHRELVKAGVEADLHVWDGLGHAFFYNADLPESKEAFAVMARFFKTHLGLK